MKEQRLQFWSLYLSRFANGFAYSTLALLIPFYTEVLNASDFMGGLFITGFTLARPSWSFRGQLRANAGERGRTRAIAGDSGR